MANRTNPAARLHSLLYEYRQVARTNLCIIHTWKEVFGVADDGDAVRKLCQAAGLIDEIDIAIKAYGDEGVREQFEHHVQAWVAAVFFPSNAGSLIPSPGVELIYVNALVALQGISSYLSITMPTSGMPSNEEITSLRQQIHEVINSVVAADAPEPQPSAGVRSAACEVALAQALSSSGPARATVNPGNGQALGVSCRSGLTESPGSSLEAIFRSMRSRIYSERTTSITRTMSSHSKRLDLVPQPEHFRLVQRRSAESSRSESSDQIG
jgi:hypothetical protein